MPGKFPSKNSVPSLAFERRLKSSQPDSQPPSLSLHLRELCLGIRARAYATYADDPLFFSIPLETISAAWQISAAANQWGITVTPTRKRRKEKGKRGRKKGRKGTGKKRWTRWRARAGRKIPLMLTSRCGKRRIRAMRASAKQAKARARARAKSAVVVEAVVVEAVAAAAARGGGMWKMRFWKRESTLTSTLSGHHPARAWRWLAG